jgi:peptide methionine sulfoxide reductase MsrA
LHSTKLPLRTWLTGLWLILQSDKGISSVRLAEAIGVIAREKTLIVRAWGAVATSAFWEAEPEHQDYLERIPNGYTCHFIRPGWKLPRRMDAA